MGDGDVCPTAAASGRVFCLDSPDVIGGDVSADPPAKDPREALPSIPLQPTSPNNPTAVTVMYIVYMRITPPSLVFVDTVILDKQTPDHQSACKALKNRLHDHYRDRTDRHFALARRNGLAVMSRLDSTESVCND